MHDLNIFRNYQQYLEDQSTIEIEECFDSISITCPEHLIESFIDILEEEYFDVEEEDGVLIVQNGTFDELIECIDFDNVYKNDLNVAIAKRKRLIRNGKRKIIFKCPPGFKKFKRRCAKRSSSDLSRLKRRARKSARKSKGKRSRAARRRKVSLRKRRGLPKPKR